MDYNVKAILEKYWSGESTLEEEQQLKVYFSQPEIDESLEKYRSLFTYFNAQQKIGMSVDVQTLINKTTDQSISKKTSRRIIPLAFWRVAAAVALLVGIFMAYQQFNPVTDKGIAWEDTYETPEEAYLKAKEVLSLVSRKMKNGTDKAAYSMNKAQIATNIIKAGH